jgi:Ca2+-binding EF-hand superfamily protein
MGCCAERPKINIEEKLENFEHALGFKKLTATDIDSLSHKFSRDFRVSMAQFKMMCKELHIESNSLLYEFLMIFFSRENECFDTQILTTLGILLASGSEQEKINLLFRNYDKDTSGALQEEEMRQMVRDVVEIAIDKMCLYASKKIEESLQVRLEEHRAELVKGKILMVNLYTKNFIADREKIDFFQFSEKFNESDNAVLLSTHKIRTIGRSIIESYQKLAEKVNLVVEQNIKIDTWIARKLSLRMSGKANKKQKKGKK